jgi:hypothetical protein
MVMLKQRYQTVTRNLQIETALQSPKGKRVAAGVIGTNLYRMK